jgi:phage regulator Rha-like protein
MTELVVIENTTPLADSRIVAETLGVDHRSFFRLITEYQDEVEADFGKVRYLVAPSGKTNQAQKYAMLTEDQSYVYLAYSKNTEKARACKRLLVKAFSEARAKLAQSQPTQGQYVNADFVLRLRLNAGRVPYDHWTVLEQIDKESHHSGLGLVQLISKARPDVSVGKKWSNYLKKQGYDVKQFMTVPNVVHPPTMLEEDVRAYPLDMLPSFLRWLHTEYSEHFSKCYLPDRTQRKELA